MTCPPPWCDRDGRTMPPAPMPPALAATVDVGKRDSPGPVDTPEVLAARLGLCACGCGQPAPLARKTSTANGVRAGQQLRFINGHNTRTRTPRTLPAPERNP